MRNIVLLFGILFALSLSLARAGTVIALADGAETDGKLTLSPSSVHVDATSATDFNLPDILEADFTDVPFQMAYFTSNGTNTLPAVWKSQDIGTPKSPGSMTYAAGAFTITAGGSAVDKKDNGDQIFFAGQPWTGDGEWTVHVQAMDPADPSPEAGLMIRDSTDAGSVMFGLGAFGGTTSKGLFHYRNKADEHPAWGGDFPLDMPVWLRLTRTGSGIDGAYSADGKQWANSGHYDTKVGANPLVGIFVNSRNDNAPAKVVLDQLSFTSTPCIAQILPVGVWLKSGSFIAGRFNQLNIDPAHPDANGTFNRSGKETMIAPNQISAVLMQPMSRAQLMAGSSQPGLLTRNGDFMAGDFQSINGEGAQLSSIALGLNKYDHGTCILHAPEPQDADFEIRLRDGSIIRASSLGVNNGKLVIGEISGVAIPVDAAEVAQFRAGTAKAQSLLELPWKATPPAAPVAPPAPAANAAPPAVNAPPANPAPPAPVEAPAPQCWEGPNQEQIMVAPAGTVIDFPLTGKFSAVALKIAPSPDMPPNSQAGVRVFVDGREAGRVPPIKAGDQPRFVEISVQDPKTVTLVADSSVPGGKVLFIDPIAIRESQPQP